MIFDKELLLDYISIFKKAIYNVVLITIMFIGIGLVVASPFVALHFILIAGGM